MSLELAINENTQALRDLIATLALRSPGAVAYAEQKAMVLEPVEAPAPKVRKAKPEAEKPEAAAPVVAPAAPVVAPAAPALTYDDIKVPFLTQLVAKHGREAGAALLRQFGVADGGKLSDIPADKWADVLAAINERAS